MSYPGAPKYSKIELQFKENVGSKILNEVLNSKVESFRSFEDCGVMITGDYLLIIQDNSVDIPESAKFTKTFIFPLNELDHYRIFNY